MAQSIFPGRGCTYAIEAGDDAGGDGLYTVDGLGRKMGDAYVLITSVSPTKKDAVQQVLTLGGRRILYTFGKAFGDVQITGEILMGDVSESGGNGPNQLGDWIESFRVSVLKEPIEVGVGQETYQVAVTSMTFGHPDPEFNNLQFLITGVTIEPRDTTT